MKTPGSFALKDARRVFSYFIKFHKFGRPSSPNRLLIKSNFSPVAETGKWQKNSTLIFNFPARRTPLSVCLIHSRQARFSRKAHHLRTHLNEKIPRQQKLGVPSNRGTPNIFPYFSGIGWFCCGFGVRVNGFSLKPSQAL